MSPSTAWIRVKSSALDSGGGRSAGLGVAGSGTGVGSSEQGVSGSGVLGDVETDGVLGAGIFNIGFNFSAVGVSVAPRGVSAVDAKSCSDSTGSSLARTGAGVKGAPPPARESTLAAPGVPLAVAGVVGLLLLASDRGVLREERINPIPNPNFFFLRFRNGDRTPAPLPLPASLRARTEPGTVDGEVGVEGMRIGDGFLGDFFGTLSSAGSTRLRLAARASPSAAAVSVLPASGETDGVFESDGPVLGTGGCCGGGGPGTLLRSAKKPDEMPGGGRGVSTCPIGRLRDPPRSCPAAPISEGLCGACTDVLRSPFPPSRAPCGRSRSPAS